MIGPGPGGGNYYHQQNQYMHQPYYFNSMGTPMIGGMPVAASQGQIYYKGGGQWRLRHNRAQYSNLAPRRSSYGDLSSSGSGNFAGDCGGGFRYSSNEDLFDSQVEVSGGVQIPVGSSMFLFCPKQKTAEEAFDLRAATEQLIDRTQQLQGSAKHTSSLFNNHSQQSRAKYGEWAI